MNIEEAVNFLVEHAAKVDAGLATIRAEMATKADLANVKEEIRNGTQAMRHYTLYVETMLNTVTRGQLSLEDKVTTMSSELDQIRQRIAELEKRNPAA